MSDLFLIQYSEKGFVNGFCIEDLCVNELGELSFYTKHGCYFIVDSKYRDSFLNKLKTIDKGSCDIQNELKG